MARVKKSNDEENEEAKKEDTNLVLSDPNKDSRTVREPVKKQEGQFTIINY